MRLKDILAKLDRVAEEYRICLLAGTRLRDELHRDPTIIQQLALTRTGLAETIQHLEQTYTVRVFAVFEWCLREIWEHTFHRQTEPPVRDLIDAAAAARGMMPPDFISDVHEVREYRNSIVHLNATEKAEITLLECANRLKAYLSHMPRQW